MTTYIRACETDLLEWAGLNGTIIIDRMDGIFLRSVADNAQDCDTMADAHWNAQDRIYQMSNHDRWRLFVAFHLEKETSLPVTDGVVMDALNLAVTNLAGTVWLMANADEIDDED